MDSPLATTLAAQTPHLCSLSTRKRAFTEITVCIGTELKRIDQEKSSDQSGNQNSVLCSTSTAGDDDDGNGIAYQNGVDTNENDEDIGFETRTRDSIIQKALLFLVHELGPDAQLRKWALATLLEPDLSTKARKILVQFLPATFPEAPTENATVSEADKCLRQCVVQDQSLLVDAIQSLEVIGESSSSSTSQSVQFCFDYLEQTQNAEFSFVIDYLLRNATGDEKVFTLIERLRSCLKNADDERIAMAAFSLIYTLRKLSRNKQHGQVCEVYMDAIDGLPTNLLPIDMAMLCYLGSHDGYHQEVHQIFENWLMSKEFPFAAVKRMMQLVGILTPRRLSLCKVEEDLIDFVLFLIVSASRTSVTDQTKYEIEELASLLAQSLSSESQSEFVGSLFRLCHETSERSLEEHIDSRVRSTTSSLNDVVCETLCRLARQCPDLVKPFRVMILKYLTDSHNSGLSLARTYVRILVNLEGKFAAESSSLGPIVRKLILSSSGNDSAIAGGISLATDIIASNCVTKSDCDSFRTLVERVMLPSSRRVVNPMIGICGIRFWMTWVNRDMNERIDSVFELVKMVVSNTAIIQLVEEYKQQRRKYLPQLTCINSNDNSLSTLPKKRLLCITLFVRPIVRNPSEWKCSYEWLFELFVAYLGLGRKRMQISDKKWNLSLWLRSLLEFPSLGFSIPRNTVAGLWLQRLFENWEYSENENAGRCNVRALFADSAVDSDKLVDSSLLLSVCLLHSAAILLSIVKHSCDCLREADQENERTQSLFLNFTDLLQMLYVVQSKLRECSTLMHSLSSLTTSKQLPGVVTHACSALESGIEHLFYSYSFLDTATLWEIHQRLQDNGNLGLGFDDGTLEQNLVLRLKLLRCTLEHTMARKDFFSKRATLLSGEPPARLNSHCDLAIQCIDRASMIKKSIISGQTYQSSSLQVLAVDELGKFAAALLRCARLTNNGKTSKGSPNNPLEVSIGCVECFVSLTERLGDVSNSRLLHEMLELMSCIAMQKECLLLSALDFGRRAIFTICEASPYSGLAPWDTEGLHDVPFRRSSSDSPILSLMEKVYNRNFSTLANIAEECGMFRFCLRRLVFLSCHLPQTHTVVDAHRFVFYTEQYIVALAGAFSGGGRGRKKTPSSAVTCFTPATFQAAYIDVLRFVIMCILCWRIEDVDEKRCSCEGGPYENLHKLYRLFGRCFMLYLNHKVLFSQSLLSEILVELRAFVDSVLAQLEYCANWRCSQPFLTPVEKRAKKVDLAATAYFDSTLRESASVMGTVARKTIAVLPKQAEVSKKKIKSLRSLLNYSQRRTEKIAAAHNLAPPSFTRDAYPEWSAPLDAPQVVEGFHVGGTERAQKRLKLALGSQTTANLKEDAQKAKADLDASSEGSFEVDGDWALDTGDDHSLEITVAPVHLILRK